MVRGLAMAVTAVMLTYQWAEIDRMALASPSEAPNSAQAAVQRLVSRAFMGLPWPRKAAGAMVMMRSSPARQVLGVCPL